MKIGASAICTAMLTQALSGAAHFSDEPVHQTLLSLQHDPEGRRTVTHYLVLEYCDGGDLADFLEARKRTGSRGLDEDTTRRLLRMLAMGLREMHSRNIVHVCISHHCSTEVNHLAGVLQLHHVGSSTQPCCLCSVI